MSNSQVLHKNATTTFKIRKLIQEADKNISNSELARKHGISRQTVIKWRNRNDINDLSTAPNKPSKQKLTESDIQLILETRKITKLPLDDLHEALGNQLSSPISRSQLSKILKKHGLTQTESEKETEKFADYEAGYVHVDCTYLPKIHGKQCKAFCAIDRITKWAYVEIHERKTKEASKEFLENLIKIYPIKIHRILTDNGSEFTYKLLPKNKQTKKEHPFDEICQENEIKHKLIKFKHPWTNGQVERFNGLLKNGTTKKCKYENLEKMIEDINRWVIWYNEECRLKSLKRMTPNQAVQNSLSKLRKTS